MVGNRQVRIPVGDLAADKIDVTAERFGCPMLWQGISLLHDAAWNQPEIAKLLLEYGADPNARTRHALASGITG
jgi:hypothetical protein